MIIHLSNFVTSHLMRIHVLFNFGQMPFLHIYNEMAYYPITKSFQFYIQISDMYIRNGHMDCQVEYMDYPEESEQ